MSLSRTLFGVMLVACMIAGFAPTLCEAAGKDNPETRIIGLRVSVKGTLTRLIFDAEGAKPKEIGPESDDGISVFFSQINTKLNDNVIKDGKAAAKEVKFRRESGFFEVIFRRKNVSVASSIRDGKKGHYTLTLDLTPGKSGKDSQRTSKEPPEDTAAKSEAKAPQPESKRLETADLFGSKTVQQVKSSAVSARSPKAEEPPHAGGTAANSKAFVEMDANALALYNSANDRFENCSRSLVLCAPEVIEAYNEALKACPRSPLAPLAIYRVGLAHSTKGDYVKADKLFKQVISEWPDHPFATRCWISIGEICNKRQAYLEAMEAFRSALRVAVETDDKAAASFELGKVFQILGVNKEALEMLNNCLSLVPNYYLKRPEVLRCLGEAYFGLGNSEKAKEPLLRYINYQQSAPDQDMVLAKIAEILLNQGEVGAANKLYSFVAKYYTGSEGDLICKIRKGELTEKENLDEAIKIFDDLRSKDLSPSLRGIVLMKLAALNLQRSNPERGLELLEEAFPAKNDGSSGAREPAALRERIICELVRQYYSEKDYIKVVQLYEKYHRIIDSLQSSPALEQVAESYASLRFYANALAIFDKIIAKGQKKNDGLLLRCAIYALRLNDNGRSFQFCKLVQSEALELKKSEILGHIFYRDQKYPDALKYFGKVVQSGKEFELDDPNSAVVYGYSLYQTKKFDEAISVLKKAMHAMKTDDTSVLRSVLMTLSKCFAEQKQYQSAADMLESAKQYSGEDQINELSYEISKLYITAGQMDKAIQSLNQLKGTEHPFWAIVAQEQLNTIDMSRTNTLP
jgi:tetratricopeptide (TPR) repeat protein